MGYDSSPMFPYVVCHVRHGMAGHMLTQRKMTLTASGTGNTAVLDVSKVLSEVNHRMYRQGRTYRVRLTIKPNQDSAEFDFPLEVYSLRPVWMTQATWRKAFETYLNAYADEIEVDKSRVARWRDFKVRMLSSSIPHQTFTALAHTVLDTGATASVQLDAGEHEFSTIAAQNVLTGSEITKSFAWICSASNLGTTYKICYEAERQNDTQESPEDTTNQSVPYQDAYTNVDDIRESEYDAIAQHGDAPPYDSEAWLDGIELAHIAQLGFFQDDQNSDGVADTSIWSKRTTGWFDAPCGFVLIRGMSSDYNGEIILEVAEGSYKGVRAHSLGVPKKSAKHGYRVVDA